MIVDPEPARNQSDTGHRSPDTVYRLPLLAYLLIVLLLATGFRIYRIDHQSFWNDEGNSARLSERSVPLIIEGTASDVHPPAYYLLLRGARELIGESEFALRSLSAFAGILTVAATIAIAKLFIPNSVAISVGLLSAISLPLIYYSQEARMYSLLACLSTLSTLFLFKYLLKFSSPSPNPSTSPSLIAYALLTTLALYTHYVYPAILVSHGFIVIIFVWTIWQGPATAAAVVKKVFKISTPWLIASSVALLLYAPWLPIFLRTGSSTREAGDATLLQFMQNSVAWLVVGPFAYLDPVASWLSWGWFPLLLVVGIGLGLRFKSFSLLAPFVWIIVTPLLMFAVGATDDNYLKFLTVIAPPLCILAGAVASAASKLIHFPFSRQFFVTLAFVPLFFIGSTLNRQYHDPQTFRADYRGMAAEIDRSGNGQTGVILNAPNQWEVFTYYYDGPATVYPLPKQREPSDKIAADVDELVGTYDRIYALFWGFEGFDPERTVERSLDAQAFKAIDEWRGDVRFVSYAVPSEPATEPTTGLDLRFGETGIRAEGVALASADRRRGDIVEVTLFWRAERVIDQRYKVFLHLLDESGTLVAQRDSEPVGNLKPTDGWGAGEMIVDNHGVLLPSDLPPGEYQLYFGLYDFADPSIRLTLVDDQTGESSDAFNLAAISVAE